MSHPELFRDMKCPFYLFGKRECRGRQPSAGVRGAPEKHLFLLLLAACGGERGKRSYWGHQGLATRKPRQGNPAPPVLGTFSKVRDDSLQGDSHLSPEKHIFYNNYRGNYSSLLATAGGSLSFYVWFCCLWRRLRCNLLHRQQNHT